MLLGTSLGLTTGCRCDSPRQDGETAESVAASKGATATDGTAPDRSEPAPLPPQEAATLLEWQEAAYGTTLFVEETTVLLLTQTAVIRITEGAPAQKMSVPLGPGPALMGDSIVYWHDGAVRAVSKAGSEPRTLGPLPRQPQRFLATDHDFAWLERGPDGAFTLSTFRDKTPHVLYRTEEAIVSATMLADWVFFVERRADQSWRVGGASMSGKATAFSEPHSGRPPSMLASAEDGIYFYDGPTRSVRRLSPDLERETVLAKNVICSPLAVSDRVVCAHVGGIFEIPGEGIPPRTLSVAPKGPTATIAADRQRVVWVTDAGENQLAVRSLALPELPPR